MAKKNRHETPALGTGPAWDDVKPEPEPQAAVATVETRETAVEPSAAAAFHAPWQADKLDYTIEIRCPEKQLPYLQAHFRHGVDVWLIRAGGNVCVGRANHFSYRPIIGDGAERHHGVVCKATMDAKVWRDAVCGAVPVKLRIRDYDVIGPVPDAPPELPKQADPAYFAI